MDQEIRLDLLLSTIGDSDRNQRHLDRYEIAIRKILTKRVMVTLINAQPTSNPYEEDAAVRGGLCGPGLPLVPLLGDCSW